MKTRDEDVLKKQYSMVYEMLSKSMGPISYNKKTSNKEGYVNVEICFNRFSETDDNTLELEMKIISDDSLKEMLCKGEVVLDFCYLNNFDYSRFDVNKTIRNLSAFFAFFDGTTCFNNAKFYDSVDFTGSIFNGSVFFERTDFGKNNTSFDYTQFARDTITTVSWISVDNISFDYSRLNRIAFYNTFFPKKVSIRCCTAEDIGFFNCTFSNDNQALLCLFSTFVKEIFINQCTLMCKQEYDLRTTDSCIIDNCILSGNVDFSNIDKESQPKALTISNTTSTAVIHADWNTIRTAINNYSYNSKSYYDASGQLISTESASVAEYNTYQARSDSFTIMKENYHNLGKYDWEDEAYVEIKRNERSLLENRSKNPNESNRLRLRLKIFLSYLIDIIGEYGTKPLKVARAMLIVYALFSLLFTAVFYSKIGNGLYWWSGCYFSGITFLTIGYGEVTPIGFTGALLAVIEGFIGMFLMSYFSVAVVRKTLR